MNFEDFKKTLSYVGLTISDFSKIVGINPQAVYGWNRKDRDIPYWVKSWLSNYATVQELEKNKAMWRSLYDEASEKLAVCNNQTKLLEKMLNETQEALDKCQNYLTRAFIALDAADLFDEIFKDDETAKSIKEKLYKLYQTRHKKHPTTRANEIIEQKAPHLHDEDKKALVEEIASQFAKEHQEVEHYKRLAQELEKLKKEFEEIKKKIEGNG